MPVGAGLHECRGQLCILRNVWELGYPEVTVTTQANGSEGAWHLRNPPENTIRAHYEIVCDAEFREKVPGT